MAGDGVDTPNGAYRRMALRWELVDALLGGTQAMRDAGTKFLPMEPKEEQAAWDNRRSRSFLFNAFKDTVGRIAGKPFTKPVTLSGADALDPALSNIETNANREGTNLTQFALQVFSDAVAHGKSHILVEFPPRPDGATLATLEALDLRPYFCHVESDELIAWRDPEDSRGLLTQARIKACESMPDGEWGEKDVATVRVIETGRWREFTDAFGNGTYSMTGDGPMLDTKGQPMPVALVVVNLDEPDEWEASPPLEDLAWLNLAHWQSSSDQRNILRFARTAILFQSGVTDDEATKKVTLGPTALIRTTNPDGDMKFVEHSGAAIGAGRQDILDLEERMQQLGLQPFIARTGGQTATGQALDEARASTDVLAWIRTLENALTKAYQLAAQWIGQTLPEGFRVNVFSEFSLATRAIDEITALIAARKGGEISRETFLGEIKRRGLISDSIDITEEIGRIEQEGPSLASIGAPFGGGLLPPAPLAPSQPPRATATAVA